jgi:hypothetical protein
MERNTTRQQQWETMLRLEQGKVAELEKQLTALAREVEPQSPEAPLCH